MWYIYIHCIYICYKKYIVTPEKIQNCDLSLYCRHFTFSMVSFLAYDRCAKAELGWLEAAVQQFRPESHESHGYWYHPLVHLLKKVMKNFQKNPTNIFIYHHGNISIFLDPIIVDIILLIYYPMEYYPMLYPSNVISELIPSYPSYHRVLSISPCLYPCLYGQSILVWVTSVFLNPTIESWTPINNPSVGIHGVHGYVWI